MPQREAVGMTGAESWEGTHAVWSSSSLVVILSSFSPADETSIPLDSSFVRLLSSGVFRRESVGPGQGLPRSLTVFWHFRKWACTYDACHDRPPLSSGGPLGKPGGA